jgi:FKBP-type peptidyl-prolyl cis-trans isomerase FkpA
MRHRFLLLATLSAIACNNNVTGLPPASNPATETFAASLGINITQMNKTASGVYYQTLRVGTGDEIKSTSDTIIVAYAGYLKDGTMFDQNSNYRVAGIPVQGFTDGIIGMREGGERKIVIPSNLGYGSETIRNSDLSIKIPRQSTLIFDITVLRVHTPADTTTTS